MTDMLDKLKADFTNASLQLQQDIGALSATMQTHARDGDLTSLSEVATKLRIKKAEASVIGQALAFIERTEKAAAEAEEKKESEE